MSDEPCIRCGEKAKKIRTLWMGCFYVIGEPVLPEVEVLFHQELEAWAKAMKPMVPDSKASGDEMAQEPGISRPGQQLHMLRVCNDCLADWMTAIEGWLKAPRVTLEERQNG